MSIETYIKTLEEIDEYGIGDKAAYIRPNGTWHIGEPGEWHGNVVEIGQDEILESGYEELAQFIDEIFAIGC